VSRGVRAGLSRLAGLIIIAQPRGLPLRFAGRNSNGSRWRTGVLRHATWRQCESGKHL